MAASSTETKMKFPSALARNNEFGGAGDTRYASSTWLRISRAHVWFNATTAANKNATQISPPAILRDSSAFGSNEKLNTTTTSSEKNSMELIASFDRHSRRKSFFSVAAVTPVLIGPPAQALILEASIPSCAPRSSLPASTQTHPQRPPAEKPGGSR